jgi:hypothetical protein
MDHESKKYEPNNYNRENVIERTSTFLSTALSTDKIRTSTDKGFFDPLPSQDVFLLMHTMHVQENPERVYDQEDTPGMNYKSNTLYFGDLDSYLEAGMLRTEPASVGEFITLTEEQVYSIAPRFFSSLDKLLSHIDFIRHISPEQRIVVLALTDQMLTIGHFVKNGSGRTNEDFLHYLGHRMDLPFTVSRSGFRGQMCFDDFETEVERTRWILRNDVKENQEAKALEILGIFEKLILALENEQVDVFDEILLGYEADDISIDPLIEIFRDATERHYTYLPEGRQFQEMLASVAAHWALFQAQEYDPGNPNASRVKEYLQWHLSELEQVYQQILDHDKRYELNKSIEALVVQVRAYIPATEKKFKEEQQRARSVAREEISPEDLQRLREYILSEEQAMIEGQRLIDESIRQYRDRQD